MSEAFTGGCQCGAVRYRATERITLTIGSMDHPERLKPKSQDGVEGRMPWFSELFHVPDDPPTEAGDSAEWAAAIRASNRQHPDHDTAVWPSKGPNP